LVCSGGPEHFDEEQGLKARLSGKRAAAADQGWDGIGDEQLTSTPSFVSQSTELNFDLEVLVE
jgi:hypothetical protein